MPFPEKPILPPGVTYAPHAKKAGPPEPMSGPELPETAAARPSTVDDNADGGVSVLDHGPGRTSTSPNLDTVPPRADGA